MVFGSGNQQGAAPVSAPSSPTGWVTYPIKTDVTLTFWTDINANLAPNFTNYSEVPFYQGWTERTGVKITYLHPPAGPGYTEQFNLMVASGDMPDIIRYDILPTYPGGPEKAISDGTILRLNDILDKYAPNLKDVFAKHPDYDRMVKTDNGSYFCFPNIREDPFLCTWQGLQIRKDWLDDLGLKTPVTFSDWHDVLTAFKTKKNSSAPLTLPFNGTAFMYGYGIDSGFYVGDDGKVVWGRAQPAYRDYLVMMAQWYKEGLLDPDTATISSTQMVTKITNGTSGAIHGALNSGMGVWLPSGRSTDPKFELMGVKNPVINNGDNLTMINIDNPYSGGNGCVSLGGPCKYPDIAARFLDWDYSQEGYMYHNFGIEGVSYNMINGYPTYTDLVMKNPNGLPIGQALAMYQQSSYGGPHLQSVDYFKQALAWPEQRQALVNWAIDDPFKHKLPPVTTTPDESKESASIMNDINTYADEMMVKFILGTEPISNYDTYISTLKKMGIDRAVEIQNAALVRYKAR